MLPQVGGVTTNLTNYKKPFEGYAEKFLSSSERVAIAADGIKSSTGNEGVVQKVAPPVDFRWKNH